MIKVLGVGNILMKDEGFGVRFVNKYKDELESEFPGMVDVVDGGTQTIPLLQFIEHADCLFIIDAVKKNDPRQKPGDILFFSKEDIIGDIRNRIKITSHSGGIHELLATAEFEGTLPERIFLIGVVPRVMTKGLEISKSLEKKMPAVKDFLTGKIRESLAGNDAER